jgi:hypothetical protein
VEECVWKLFQLSPATGNAPKSAEPLTVLKAESPGFAGESLGPAKLIEIDFPVPANDGNAVATQIAATAVIVLMLMFIFSFIGGNS